MQNSIDVSAAEKSSMKAEVPDFEVGDTVDVHCRILEGEKERIQILNGLVIARAGSGSRERHRAADRAGRGRGTQVPAALAADRHDRSEAVRRHPPGEALLSPRSHRQGRPLKREVATPAVAPRRSVDSWVPLLACPQC